MPVTASPQQLARLDRMWSGFQRAGLLQEAVVNGSNRVDVLWAEAAREHFGVVDEPHLAVIARTADLESPQRGDEIDIGDSRYRVIRVAPYAVAQTELVLEVVT